MGLPLEIEGFLVNGTPSSELLGLFLSIFSPQELPIKSSMLRGTGYCMKIGKMPKALGKKGGRVEGNARAPFLGNPSESSSPRLCYFLQQLVSPTKSSSAVVYMYLEQIVSVMKVFGTTHHRRFCFEFLGYHAMNHQTLVAKPFQVSCERGRRKSRNQT